MNWALILNTNSSFRFSKFDGFKMLAWFTNVRSFEGQKYDLTSKNVLRNFVHDSMFIRWGKTFQHIFQQSKTYWLFITVSHSITSQWYICLSCQNHKNSLQALVFRIRIGSLHWIAFSNTAFLNDLQTAIPHKMREWEWSFHSFQWFWLAEFGRKLKIWTIHKLICLLRPFLAGGSLSTLRQLHYLLQYDYTANEWWARQCEIWRAN